jgi:hypothetical protein
MGQSVGDLSGQPLCLLLLERVDQLDAREAANALSIMLDGLHADGGRNVRLAGAGSADQDDIVGIIDEVATMQCRTRASLISLLVKSNPLRSL